MNIADRRANSHDCRRTIAASFSAWGKTSSAYSSDEYLLIGYGNTLRGDDGVGYRVAEMVQSWNLDHVRSHPCHQLTPDLAAMIAHAKMVIFVDALAIASLKVTEVHVELLRADSATTVLGHYADPRSLLALTQALYQTVPDAVQILIPAIDCAFGETLSTTTHNHLLTALEKIKAIVGVSESIPMS